MGRSGEVAAAARAGVMSGMLEGTPFSSKSKRKSDVEAMGGRRSRSTGEAGTPREDDAIGWSS